MASNQDKLAGYLLTELVKAFDIQGSSVELEKFSKALSKAIHKYATTDLEVETKIQVESTFNWTTPVTPPTPGSTEIIEVKGQTVTKGKMI